MLVRWNYGHNEFANHHRHFDRRLDDVFRSVLPLLGRPSASSSGPGFNVYENETHYVLQAALPGFEHEKLDLQASEDELVIKGEREVSAPEGYRTLRSERGSDRFERTFTFGKKLDPQKVDAKLEAGVLTIELAKQVQETPRRITVKAA